MKENVLNSKERVLAALECKKPDRVPICEMFIDESVRKKICKNGSYEDFINMLDLDVVLVSSNNRKQKIGDRKYKDDWDVIYKDTGQNEMIEIEFPIISKKDLLKYNPPNPLEDQRLLELRELVKIFKEKRAIVFRISDSFSIPRKLMGMENLLISYLTNPSLVHELIKMSVEYNLILLENAIKLGADILVSADDYADKATTMMSPKHFKDYVLPGLTKIVSRTHELGAKYIKHTDGNITGILDMLVESGIDGLHPIDPSAGMNIFEVKKQYMERICLIGNVDCVNTLCKSSTQEVEREVKDLIYGLKEYGGFMVASSNSIHKGVKIENFFAMIEAVKKYGRLN
jgi:uroporphyrinogen decarboxylase